MDYKFLLELAIILISTKALGILMKKIGMPQVVGALVAGIIIGPTFLKWVEPSTALTNIAELGVIMIIFSAGLETNIKDIKNTGLTAFLIAMGGVFLPLIAGFVISSLFHGGFANVDKATVLKNVFIGVILTATSISITVETLKELGKLKTKVGTIIISAAIIDDIIGIAVLSIVLGLNKAEVSPVLAIVKTIVFFALAIGLGSLIHLLFKYLSKKYPRQRRIPIFAFAVCLLYAYCAEEFFGVADITGAYVAGIIFSGISVSDYIDKKIDINSYMIFAPVFFAYIGIKSSLAGFDISLLWFAVAFVLTGILSKAIGCFLVSKAFKFNNKDSLIIGIGMIARGEVALVVMQKGITGGIIDAAYLAVVVSLVIVSTLIAPILLKLMFKRNETEELLPLDISLK